MSLVEQDLQLAMKEDKITQEDIESSGNISEQINSLILILHGDM